MVAQVLLPRAALKEAITKGSVEAIDAFARTHPNTGIGKEIDAARQNALTAEFARARDAATFPSLLGFGLNAYVADPEQWCAFFKMPDDGPPGMWRLVLPVAGDRAPDAGGGA